MHYTYVRTYTINSHDKTVNFFTFYFGAIKLKLRNKYCTNKVRFKYTDN